MKPTVRCLLLIFICLILSSLVFSKIQVLKHDKLSPKCQSIVFGRLRVLSSIPNFDPNINMCELYIQDVNGTSEEYPFYIRPELNQKITKENFHGYDIPFYAEVEGGNYLFSHLINDFDNLNISQVADTASNYFFNNTDTSISKSCEIPSNHLVYLGIIEIDYTNITYNEVTHNIYLKCFLRSDDDFDADLSNFQKKYPNLYQQFKDKVIKKYLVPISNSYTLRG